MVKRRKESTTRIDASKLKVDVPKLNTSGESHAVVKKSRKKGRKLVQDPQEILKILKPINDTLEKKVKSKLERAYELEKIRAAKRTEIEAKENAKRSELEEAKKQILAAKKKNKKNSKASNSNNSDAGLADAVRKTRSAKKANEKRVKFADA